MQNPTIQLLINNEEFLYLRHLKRLESKLVQQDTKDFNYAKISVKDMSVAALIDVFQTLPMMANDRMVVVTDCESIKKNDEKVLAEYFLKPNPTTHIILIGTKFDKRTSLYKNIKKVGEVFEFKALFPNKVPAFITQEASQMGLGLDRGVPEQIAEIVGTNLLSLVGELEKLALYVLPNKQITLKHVNELISQGMVENIFKITDFIAKRSLKDATNLYAKMNEQGEPLIKIMALVVNHFRKLKLTKSALKEGKPPASLASVLGVNPYFVKTYQMQAKSFNDIQLDNIYKKLMNVSEQIRTVNLSQKTIFETFLQEVCLNG